jgi:hypothetical protein
MSHVNQHELAGSCASRHTSSSKTNMGDQPSLPQDSPTMPTLANLRTHADNSTFGLGHSRLMAEAVCRRKFRCRLASGNAFAPKIYTYVRYGPVDAVIFIHWPRGLRWHELAGLSHYQHLKKRHGRASSLGSVKMSVQPLFLLSREAALLPILVG